MTTMSLDPLAASVHAHIEQIRREADVDRLARSASNRRAYSWPAGVAAAMRDSLAAGFSRPGRATTTNRSSAAGCA